MKSFATTGHVALHVTLGGGEVTVEASAEPNVEIDLVPLRDNEATRQAIAEARIQITNRGDGHEIIVQLQKKSGFVVGRGAKVGVRVRCPRGSDLELRCGSANLDATGTLGKVDVKSASGDVSIEDVKRLEVNTASGDLRVRDVEQALGCRTASGDVAVRRCLGPITAHLVSGDLLVGEAAAGLTVITVSGDVRFDAAGGGGMQVQSVSGDVYLAIKEGERLYIDASSVSGTMSSDLAVGDVPANDGGAVYDVRVRTVSGDLQIARAATVTA